MHKMIEMCDSKLTSSKSEFLGPIKGVRILRFGFYYGEGVQNNLTANWIKITCCTDRILTKWIFQGHALQASMSVFFCGCALVIFQAQARVKDQKSVALVELGSFWELALLAYTRICQYYKLCSTNLSKVELNSTISHLAKFQQALLWYDELNDRIEQITKVMQVNNNIWKLNLREALTDGHGH